MWVFIVFIALIVWFLHDNAIRGRRYPPGPIRLPVIGNLIQLSLWSKSEPQPYIVLKEVSKHYGPISFLKMGFLDQVLVDDPDLMKSILQSDKWSNRPLLDFIMDRSFGKPYGILWGRDEAHKEMRRFSIRTLRDFGFGKQTSQEAVIEDEVMELFSRLNSRLESEGNIICMQQFFNISVLNILWSMMAGVRFSHDDPEFKALVNMINQTMKLLGGNGNIFMAFPFLRHILPKLTGYGQVRTETLNHLRGIFFQILEERRELSLYKDEQRDFIDVFLNEIDKHKNDKDETIFSERQFVITVMDLFVAGSETTANSLEFAILYMIRYPAVQKKVRDEIDRIIGRNKFPHSVNKPDMPYTEATLLEVLRLSSVVPVIVRCPQEDTPLGSYIVKKDTFTIMNTYSAHRNPKFWNDPNSFNPDRFLDSNNRIINADKLLTFGLGKRICLGEILARATLFTFFVSMLQNYTFDSSPHHPEPSLEGVPGLTLSPKPFYALIKRRLHL